MSIAILFMPMSISIIIIMLRLIIKVLIEKKEATMITIKVVSCSVYIGNLLLIVIVKDRVLYRFAAEV